jgi:hypothetical protein
MVFYETTMFFRKILLKKDAGVQIWPLKEEKRNVILNVVNRSG